MSKETVSWHSERLDREINLVRWGEVGTPLLVFPTAGGDAEEIERFHLVSAVGEFLEKQQQALIDLAPLGIRSEAEALDFINADKSYFEEDDLQ